MTRSRTVLATTAALLLALSAGIASLVTSTSAHAATQLCQSQTAAVSGGYIVQNNEWGSSQPECVTTSGGADFTVANSSIANSTSGAPGGYPSIYQGCHWGNCSAGGLSTSPMQASTITAGKVTTSWSTTQPGGSNDYDVAYDIWFNQTSTTNGQPNGTEMMIWLNHNGPVQPFGSQVATNTTIGGRGYNVWFGTQGWNTLSYTMSTGTTSVSGLDLAPLVADAISRGYLQPSWWLIDIEAGMELWQGGAGLKTNSFSVSLNGSVQPPPTTTPPTTQPPTTQPPTTQPPTTPPAGGGGCSAAYSVTSSWTGGFQGQVMVTNTGTSTKNGWKLGWTLPSGVTITNLWNGTLSTSGSSVTVTNAPYNGSLAPNGTATVGFTANGPSSGSPSVTCS